MRTSNVAVNGKIIGTKENGPGASAANTGVSPGPDLSINLDMTERGPASTMVEPTSTPVIHPTQDGWAHDHIADSQTCPLCFSPVAHNVTRENRGVVLATYVCGGVLEHVWMLKFALNQVTA